MRTLFDDLERGPLPVARGGAGEQGADGLDRLAIAANDAADVGLAQLHPEDRRFSRRDLRKHHLIGELDQLTNDELEKLFHGPEFIRASRFVTTRSRRSPRNSKCL